MTTTSTTGYLEIILGPMYASKSTRLVEIYKQCKFCNIPVTVINHIIDNRYDNQLLSTTDYELLSTHDQVKIPCLQACELNDIWTDNGYKKTGEKRDLWWHNAVRDSQVILINEGQFFLDLYDVVVDMLRCNKKVYVCGLDGDFERKKFGAILDLIPLCDKVTKLTSLCSICKDGTPGIFSMRLTNEKQQTVVGSDNYIPVCRKCYEK
jgi:thymidine kinase